MPGSRCRRLAAQPQVVWLRPRQAGRSSAYAFAPPLRPVGHLRVFRRVLTSRLKSERVPSSGRLWFFAGQYPTRGRNHTWSARCDAVRRGQRGHWDRRVTLKLCHNRVGAELQGVTTRYCRMPRRHIPGVPLRQGRRLHHGDLYRRDSDSREHPVLDPVGLATGPRTVCSKSFSPTPTFIPPSSSPVRVDTSGVRRVGSKPAGRP